MKHSNSSIGYALVMGLMLSGLSLLLFAPPVFAVTSGANPYDGIVVRNSFGLKPPPDPADSVKPPPPPVSANIKLQGFTTLLGPKQVLLKIAVPAKAPEPAHEKSVVLAEGQREGEVKVLEINTVARTVKLDNAGTILSLNIKDNGDKPTPGAAPPAAGLHPAGTRPGGPPATRLSIPGSPAPAAHPAGASMTAFGAATPQNVSTFGSSANNSGTAGFGNASQTGQHTSPTIPTRTLRTSTTTGGGVTLGGGEFQHLSPEAQAILIEAQRAQISAGGFDPLPKTPITPRQNP